MKHELSKLLLIAGVASVFPCMAQEQGAATLENGDRLTDRFGTITLSMPANWHDETEQRLAAVGSTEKFRGDSRGRMGKNLLLAIKKDTERRPKGNAGCMFVSLVLPSEYPATLEKTKVIVERLANDLHESYRKAEIADFLRRGLSVSVQHSAPQRADLDRSQEIQIGGRSGWEQIWKIWHERARDPLISVTASVVLDMQQMGKGNKALIVQCTFTGKESRTPWGGKSPEERIHDLLHTVRINEFHPDAAGDAALSAAPPL